MTLRPMEWEVRLPLSGKAVAIVRAVQLGTVAIEGDCIEWVRCRAHAGHGARHRRRPVQTVHRFELEVGLYVE